MSARLPDGFAELEPHLGWALETERERADHRAASSYPDVEAFYQAVRPLAPRALELLGGFRLDELEGPLRTLMLLMLSFAEASFAVEAYQQVDVVRGLHVSRFEMLPVVGGTF